MASRIKGLKLRIKALRDELSTCTTEAMRRCVNESLVDAERQLHEILNSK